VGGNKFLVESDTTSVMLDFGLSYAGRGKFFADPYLSPRDLTTLVELGIVPDIHGAYSEEGDKPFEAIILSHAHRDHSGHASLTREDMDIYSGEAASRILSALSNTSRERFEFSFGDRPMKQFHSGDRLRFGDIEVEPVHVDHSVPGAYGFIVRTPSGIIGYTGDFRVHGPFSHMTKDFIERMKSDRPNVLLMEHTNILEGEVSTESEVQSKLSSVMKMTPGLVMGDFALADVDRYKSFYAATTENGRQMVITPKRAYVMDSLMADPRITLPDRDDGVRVMEREVSRPQKWEDSICDKWGTVSAAEIHSQQRKYTLVIPPAEMQSALKISPKSGSVFLFSSSEPFNEEMELDYDRLMNWLDAMGVPVYKVHASGHAMPIDLKDMISEVRPEIVVPIHGEHPEMVMRYFRDLPVKVYIPSLGEPIPL